MASSNIKTTGSQIRALAIAILYFWPPESLDPFEPQFIKYPEGSSVVSAIRLEYISSFEGSWLIEIKSSFRISSLEKSHIKSSAFAI